MTPLTTPLPERAPLALLSSGGDLWLDANTPRSTCPNRQGATAKRTMKVFDELCLTPVEDMAPDRIRKIQMGENASRAVFARYLNVTKGLVSQWERGGKRRRSASLKLLTLVAKNGLDTLRMSATEISRRHPATETVTGDGNRSVVR